MIRLFSSVGREARQQTFNLYQAGAVPARCIMKFNLKHEQVVIPIKPQYWYHITDKNLGEEKTFLPRRASEAFFYKAVKKYICVAPSVVHCLSALQIHGTREGKLYVYRTKNKVVGHYPIPDFVYDDHVTKERWLINPTKFILVDIIPQRITLWGAKRNQKPIYYSIFCLKGWKKLLDFK